MSITNLDRRRNVSRSDFINHYLNANRPLILEGLLDQWPAMRLWDKNYLQYHCGHEMVEVMTDRSNDPNYEINCESHRKQYPFRSYIEHVFSGAGNDLYLVANNRFLDTITGRRLLADAPPFPEYLHPDTTGRAFLWLGPKGTVTPLHYDSCDLMLAQVIGAKRIRLIEPSARPMLYNTLGVFSDVDYDAPNLSAHPLFARVQALDFILNAGDVVFIPIGWWHCVTSLSASASVSFTNFIR